jgi:2-methylcitrate dehydratase PrpD
MMDDGSGATRQLATFLAASRWEDIPLPVRSEAVRSLLNSVGCAVGGAGDPAIDTAIRALRPYFGPAQASIVGRSERADALNAAFLNAASANVLEYDDTHLPTVMHPAAPVVPAALAVAEQRRVSGAELLHAIVLGIEAGCRVGNALMPNHYRRGYHITASCGVFGAAASAGRLLGLDAERMLWALGHAATQSAGLVESLGSMSKSLGVGNSAKNGLAAAVLAAEGLTGPERAIEGRYGFAAATSETIDLARITEGLGASWEITRNAYKPYPCGVVLFPVIDACLELRRRYRPAIERIAGIAVRGHPLLRERTDRPVVRDGRDAKVSLQHSVAVAFLYGAAGLAQYDDAVVADPAVRALSAKVAAHDDEAIPVEAATVSLHLTEGEVYSEHVRHGRGTPGRRMSDAELDAKVTELAAYGPARIDAARLIAAIREIASQEDAAGFLRLTLPR